MPGWGPESILPVSAIAPAARKRKTRSPRVTGRFGRVGLRLRAVQFDQTWKAHFERLADRIGRRKAIVAIARKLLVVIWHVLYHQRVDRQADPERVVRYFLAWGRQARALPRLGLKASEFARQQLDILAIGQELPELITFGATYRLPPSTLPTAAELDPAA